jgi:SAM-dependent methyltransferase
MAHSGASLSQQDEGIAVSIVEYRLGNSSLCLREHFMSTTPNTGRSRDALRRHYEIERELADQLRTAPPELRKVLYRTVYNELFQRVPDHPQITRKQDSAMQQAATERQLRLLRAFLKPGAVYLEIGAGDCHLAMDIARRVRRVYAVDVSDLISGGAHRPDNFTLIPSDGVSVDIPSGIIDVAYSHQLMEHLHPDDALDQLKNIYASLAPGGVYLCTTPHRLSGPHDVSRYFDSVATGFHLREYSYGGLRDLFHRAGFESTRGWAVVKGRSFGIPGMIIAAAEWILVRLPRRLRIGLIRSTPLRVIFDSVTILGRKSSAGVAPEATRRDAVRVGDGQVGR